MANTFPAMISNEPPPLEGIDDDEEEEESNGEYNEFQSRGLKIDISDSPYSTPSKTPSKTSIVNETTSTSETHSKLTNGITTINTTDEEESEYHHNHINSVNDAIQEEDVEIDEKGEGVEELPNSIVSEEDVIKNNSLSDTNSQEEFEDYQKVNENISSSKEISQEEVLNSNETMSEEHKDKLSQKNEEVKTDFINPNPLSQINQEDIDENNSSLLELKFKENEPNLLPENVEEPISKNETEVEIVVKKEENEISEDFNDDDFGDFENFSEVPFQVNFPPPETEANSDELEKKERVEEDADFDDFQDFQSTSLSYDQQQPCSTSIQPLQSTHLSQTSDLPPTSQPQFFSSSEFKLGNLVKSVFILEEDEEEVQLKDLHCDKVIQPIDKELKSDTSNFEMWSKVQDFEGSQSLIFKWLNCESHQKLLKSLKVDTSTIMYSGKWGPVPKFAKSIISQPLQPEISNFPTTSSANNVDGEGEKKASTSNTSNSSNTTENDKDCGREITGNNGTKISKETQEILTQLPDLSFMQAKTLVFPNN